MAYLCPVCATVEADAEHLANHLAVTASLHEGDHQTWLEEHAPDWPDRSPSELGATVVEHAREQPTADGHAVDDHTEGAKPSVEPIREPTPVQQLDAETERVLREARELTEQAVDDSERGSDESG